VLGKAKYDLAVFEGEITADFTDYEKDITNYGADINNYEKRCH
jgi:hypothetical protein